MGTPKTKILIATATLLFLTIALAITTSGLLTSQQSVSNRGAITHTVGIGLYTDQATTTTCTSIDWGSISAQDSNTRVIYVKNTGNTTETLHLITSEWNPASASSMLTLTWDKENSTLAAGSVVTATLTLAMGEDLGTVDNFDFNIIISCDA